MKKLDLRFYPDPILRRKAGPIESCDDEVREIAEAMVATMYREKGIGLAAPQVGISRRLIVVLQMKDVDDTGAPPLALVNPRVLSVSKDTWSYEEGCLSIPGVNAAVTRPVRVEVEYTDLEGNLRRISDEGILGRILLHEIDHLDGTLFIDYLSSAQKSLIRSQLRQLSEDYSSA